MQKNEFAFTSAHLASSSVSGTSTTYSYDALDRLQTLTSGGTTATYWYGDGRDRIAKSTGGYTTLYINPLVEYNRNGFSDAVMVDGARISTVDESASRWHVKDHLRSTAITIGDDGTLFEAIRYTPYGAERDRAGSYKSSHTYTDQVSDYESDLLYYNSRYYNPSLRTFTSPDPVAGYTPEQVLATPQLQNTFSYVANNPIVYVDPDGLYAIPAASLVPAVGIGPAGWLAIGAVALVGTAYLAYESIDYDNLQTGIIQPTKQELLETPPPVQDPNDLKPPKDKLPKGFGPLYKTLALGSLGYEVYDQYQKQKKGTETFVERSQPQQTTKQNPVIKSGSSQSISSGHSSARYSVTASSLQFSSGDYASAISYLQQASDSLNQ